MTPLHHPKGTLLKSNVGFGPATTSSICSQDGNADVATFSLENQALPYIRMQTVQPECQRMQSDLGSGAAPNGRHLHSIIPGSGPGNPYSSHVHSMRTMQIVSQPPKIILSFQPESKPAQVDFGLGLPAKVDFGLGPTAQVDFGLGPPSGPSP